jgi:streptomycin 3"-adenylyltransferase
VSGAVPEQAERATTILREAMGDAVLGVYLHGSAVEGGLRPRSDIDVLGVTRRPSTREERRSIVARLLAISGWHAVEGPARSIELTMVVQDEVRPWRYPPPLDLQYGDWWRAELERDEEPWTSPNPDLAIVLTAARTSARPLVGPPITEAIDPVPVPDLRRALLDALPSLLADLEGDEANVVLTLTRMWLTMVTGAIEPKDVAAGWAIERLPVQHRAVVARARAVYVDGTADDWADLRVELRACVDLLVTAIRRAAP